MSCIVFLICNDVFVKNYLLPSIIRNSGDHPVEIIIVYNGVGCNLADFKKLLFDSEE